MYAVVLIPVMFAAIIIGALLGGGARSTTACEASYSVGGVSPLASRPSCPVADKAKSGVRKTISTTVRLACTAAPSRFITMTGHDQAFGPAARAEAYGGWPARNVLNLSQGRRIWCRSSSSGMRRPSY